MPGIVEFPTIVQQAAQQLGAINAPVCNRIDAHSRADVGDLKFNRKVRFRGVELRVDAMAAEMPVTARQKVTVGERTPWSFTKTIQMPEVKHAVRVAILRPHWNSTKPAKILTTNQTPWEVTRVLRGDGQRRTGTETLPRDGQQHWGLGDCQLRNGEGQTRHIYSFQENVFHYELSRMNTNGGIGNR